MDSKNSGVDSVNEEQTNAKIDTRLTQEDSRKVLAQMAKAYEAAPEPCKGSLGLFMRQALADHVKAGGET